MKTASLVHLGLLLAMLVFLIGRLLQHEAAVPAPFADNELREAPVTVTAPTNVSPAAESSGGTLEPELMVALDEARRRVRDRRAAPQIERRPSTL
jgi:hypothetical protein